MAEDKSPNQFLKLLRASDGGFLQDQQKQQQQQEQEQHKQQPGSSGKNPQQNEETVRASNVASHGRSQSSLPELFIPPESMAPSGVGPSDPMHQPSKPTPTIPVNIQPRTKIQDLGPLPPRPRMSSIEKESASTSFANSKAEMDDEPLMGERISLGEERRTRVPQSVLSPAARKNVVDVFLHPNDSPSRPAAINSRDRAVSFDAQAMQRDQEHRQQLREREREIGGRIINLDDILAAGPYEVEAETNILKAIEEQPSHRRFRSETSTILSYVPENIDHDFSMEGYVEVDKLDSMDDGGPSSFENGLSSGKGQNSAEERDIEQGIPLLKAARKRHRRSMSVEDRLAGLTTQMCLLDINSSDRKTTAELRAERRPPNNVSSADVFRHNAALVSNTEDGSLPSKSKTSDISHALSRVEEGVDEEGSTTSSDASGPNNPTDPSADVKSRRSRLIAGATDTLKDDWEIWSGFFNPRKEHIATFTKTLVLYFGIPLVAVAAILFYAVQNPPTGFSVDGSPGSRASASWWLLFCLRQGLTLSLALLLQLFIVDFLSIGTRVMLKLVGPILTLLMVQSKGIGKAADCVDVVLRGLFSHAGFNSQHYYSRLLVLSLL
jgi:hypothetical protein